jgi:Ser/Thr protein kinase RdoA (MazF antagonist)
MRDGAELRKAARGALREFAIPYATLTQIASRHNDVFRVTTWAKRKYVLRVQNQVLSDAEVRSQLKWMESLERDGGIAVPRPVRTSDARPFTFVECAGQRRRAVLLHWLLGKTANIRTESVYRSAADLVARMHRHSEQFRVGRNFAVRRLDGEWLFGSRFFVHSPAAKGRLKTPDREAARMAERFVRRAMESLGRGKNRFGLIHADLNLDNIVFNHGEASPIDFDEFGLGWYLFDIAELIRTSVTPDNWRERKEFVLRLYQQSRSLAAVETEAMDGFIVAAFVQYLNWAFLHARNDQDLKWVGFCLDVIRSVIRR